jgi:hypothetical protein
VVGCHRRVGRVLVMRMYRPCRIEINDRTGESERPENDLMTALPSAKYAVKVVAYEDKADPSKWWVATAGWDECVLVYCLNLVVVDIGRVSARDEEERLVAVHMWDEQQ